MKINVSRRAGDITPFLAMEVMERAGELKSQGKDIIFLCLGEPDFPAPEPVVESAIAAMKSGKTAYTHSLGRIELRQAIVDHYRRRYGVAITTDQVIVSSGTSPLMLLLFASLLNEGDEMILPDPSYACYPNFLRFLGGKTVYLRTREEDGFQPRPAEVKKRINSKTRGILINSPSNPAGSVIPTKWLEELSALSVPLISDEIYHGLTYEGEERSALEFTSEAFVLGGFSKAYAMTGWRLGYLIAPLSSVRTLQNLHQNFLICANSFVQCAGVTALRECAGHVERMRAAYDKRRKYTLEGVRRLGLGVRKEPTGAFYVLADARHISGDSLALAKEVLEETGVALTPGIDFGAGAEGYLRFSYSNSIENLGRAFGRLETWFRERGFLK